MEPKTTQELMEIQSALQGELAITSEICFQNESGKAEDTYTGFFLDISKKTQGQKNSSRKKLKQIFQKTQANNSKTQYFAN